VAILVDIMGRSVQLLPPQQRQFLQLGERLKLARLLRRLSATLVAERVSVSRVTLHKIASGEPNVAMGSYFQVLRVLGLEADFGLLALDDIICAILVSGWRSDSGLERCRIRLLCFGNPK
jgi:transcriptional regulator with XRE-family HTH domain